MTNSHVRHWEGLGDLSVLEVERECRQPDATVLAPFFDSRAHCLLLSEGYVRAGKLYARHYLMEIDESAWATDN
jgi:hypothetical protein